MTGAAYIDERADDKQMEALGAYLGSRLGRSKGHKLVRSLFLVLGGSLGIKLALGW